MRSLGSESRINISSSFHTYHYRQNDKKEATFPYEQYNFRTFSMDLQCRLGSFQTGIHIVLDSNFLFYFGP